MATKDLRALRREYLFPLSHLCHLPPHLSDDLAIQDWADLTDDIDHYIRASTPKG